MLFPCILQFNLPAISSILFNPFKHHLGVLQQLLDEVLPADLPAALKKIGTSQMDMYTGNLTPEEIYQQILTSLQGQGIEAPEAFAAYLNIRKGYMDIVLTDTSRWILRLADDPVRYIHLHPGRYSPHSLRIKAAALKTAMAYKAAARMGQLSGILLDDINQVRTIAALSPVRKLEDLQHIKKILTLIGCKVSEEI
ncbi:hypothetical protein [Chitinophaga flava]|uniref:hypothetical protein n=1 Tax=Chitinophaga flava TaxID=2259036 RepID=UPI000DE4B34D|nr:hypothetical protein [Chitinophaga flava]